MLIMNELPIKELRGAVTKELYIRFVFDVSTHSSSFISGIGTVMTNLPDVDAHSFDNTELKVKIRKAVI